MINSVVLVGSLVTLPLLKNGDSTHYEFTIRIKRPLLNFQKKPYKDIVEIKAHSFVVKEAWANLKPQTIVAIQGRVFVEMHRTLIFADCLLVLGKN